MGEASLRHARQRRRPLILLLGIFADGITGEFEITPERCQLREHGVASGAVHPGLAGQTGHGLGLVA